MKKQYIYELIIENNNTFSIINAGLIIKEVFSGNLSDDNMVYRQKETIGYYIVEDITNKQIKITLKVYQDLGDSFNCKLDFKTNDEIFYSNQYSNKLVVETIIVDFFNNKNLYKATLKEFTDDACKYIDKEY